MPAKERLKSSSKQRSVAAQIDPMLLISAVKPINPDSRPAPDQRPVFIYTADPCIWLG